MGWARSIAPIVVLALCAGWGAWGRGQGSSAARVTVRQVDSFGTELAAEAYVYTDEAFTSVEAPTREGYRFIHWAVSPSQPNFANRDAWGRALDAVTVVPKDSVVTLTAVYADAAEDTDGDGIPDADERYWYGTPDAYDTAGTLQHAAESDTDGDGYTFAQELQYGLNPLFPNELRLGGVAHGDTNVVLYKATPTWCSTTRTATWPTRCGRSRKGSSSRPTAATRARGRSSRPRSPSRRPPPPSPTGR